MEKYNATIIEVAIIWGAVILESARILENQLISLRYLRLSMAEQQAA
ncbi:MAG: hypothetical protein ABSA75_08090 [Candidatus Bathyarchaeia archaeon]|jgi:hypothetical protein